MNRFWKNLHNPNLFVTLETTDLIDDEDDPCLHVKEKRYQSVINFWAKHLRKWWQTWRGTRGREKWYYLFPFNKQSTSRRRNREIPPVMTQMKSILRLRNGENFRVILANETEKVEDNRYKYNALSNKLFLLYVNSLLSLTFSLLHFFYVIRIIMNFSSIKSVQCTTVS